MNANTVDAEQAVASAPTVAVRPMLTLIRREFWEHRALWIAPLAVTALMLLGAALGRVNIFLPQGGMLSPNIARAWFVVGVLGYGFVQYVTMSFVLAYYASDCLYAERRDRSILFWKSMPVSDAQTVLSKALVALVIVPVGVYVIALATSLAAFGIWGLRALLGSVPGLYWDTDVWLRIEWDSLVGTIVLALWYAPVTSYLMLISAWARRYLILWILLPPIVAAIVERIALGTHYVSNVILYRLGPGWQSQLTASLERLWSGPALGPGPGAAPAAPQPFEGFHPAQAFSNVDLWIGLGVAAALLFVATRIRRYRDDT